eukprot:154224_1
MSYLLKSGYESEEPLYPISAGIPPDSSLQDGFPNIYESPEQIMAHFMNHYTDRSVSPTPYLNTYHYNRKCDNNSNQYVHEFTSYNNNNMDFHTPLLSFTQAPTISHPITNTQPFQYMKYYQQENCITSINPTNTQPIIPTHQTITAINPLPPNIDINMNNIAAALPKLWYPNTTLNQNTNTPQSSMQNVNNISNNISNKLSESTIIKTDCEQKDNQSNQSNQIIKKMKRKSKDDTVIKKKKRGRPKKKIAAKQIKKNCRKKASLCVQNTKIPLLSMGMNIDNDKRYVNTTCSPQRKRSIKNLPCSYCHKRFATNYELKRHLPIHSAERPYKQKQHMITHKKSVHENYKHIDVGNDIMESELSKIGEHDSSAPQNVDELLQIVAHKFNLDISTYIR